MASEHTSVPRPAGAIPPPPRARETVAVSFTAAGAEAVQGWLELSGLGTPHRHIRALRADGRTLADLGEVVQGSKIGVHLVFSGPQTDIYAARAQALRKGAIDAEITLLETGVAEAKVYCAHCKETTTTQNDVGATAVCSGCARELVIYHHFSRRTASYLGFMANAEEAI